MSFKDETTSGCQTKKTGLREEKPLTIGMIVMSYYPELCGGAERQCSRLTNEFLSRGHRVTIVTTRAIRKTPSSTIEERLKIIRISRLDILLPQKENTLKNGMQENGFANVKEKIPHIGAFSRSAALAVQYINIILFMFGSFRLIWALRKEIDVWHVHVAGLYAGWCGFWAKSFGIPLVCKCANLPVFPYEAVMPLRRWLMKVRRSLNFVALTAEMKDDLLANGVAESKVTLIPNGIELSKGSPRSDPGHGGTILYVANFTQPVENKAYDILFAAWRKVYKARPFATLTVAGGGDTSPWSKLLSQDDSGASVEFLGYVENMQELYQRALMLVLPSRREGISNALLEAQSIGVPAIVSDIPGNTAVVVDGQNGLVVPVGDAEALSHAIILLLDDKEKREKMGQQASIKIAGNFSLSSIADRYLELYSKLVATADKPIFSLTRSD